MDPVVTAAVISSVAVLIGTFVTVMFSRTTRKIVKGNGKGNLTEMLEDVIDRQERHERKTDTLLDWQIAHERLHAVDK
jgi:hypothetical protein